MVKARVEDVRKIKAQALDHCVLLDDVHACNYDVRRQERDLGARQGTRTVGDAGVMT